MTKTRESKKFRALIEYVVYEGEGTTKSENKLWREDLLPFAFCDDSAKLKFFEVKRIF